MNQLIFLFFNLVLPLGFVFLFIKVAFSGNVWVGGAVELVNEIDSSFVEMSKLPINKEWSGMLLGTSNL